MKKINKNSGFTMLEIIVAVALLSIITLGSAVYVTNSFKDSTRIISKSEVQASVTALMNKIQTTIKTADIPVFYGEIKDTEFKIIQLKNKERVLVEFSYNNGVVTVKENNKTTKYKHVEKIEINTDNAKDSSGNIIGATITIHGADNHYTLSSTYYTRNMLSNAQLGEYYEDNERIVTVTYDTNGGYEPNFYDSKKLLENSTTALFIVTDDIPTRGLGLSFDYWREVETSQQYVAGDELLIDGDITLEATWKTVPVLTYYKNDGTNSVYFAINAENDESEIIFDIPARTGYNFLGWSNSSNGNATYYPGQTISITQNTSLYAVWQQS